MISCREKGTPFCEFLSLFFFLLALVSIPDTKCRSRDRKSDCMWRSAGRLTQIGVLRAQLTRPSSGSTPMQQGKHTRSNLGEALRGDTETHDTCRSCRRRREQLDDDTQQGVVSNQIPFVEVSEECLTISTTLWAEIVRLSKVTDTIEKGLSGNCLHSSELRDRQEKMALHGNSSATFLSLRSRSS